MTCELEHEIGWKTLSVALDLLDQPTGFDTVKRCQILVEHHMTVTHKNDPLRNCRDWHQLYSVRLGGAVRHEYRVPEGSDECLSVGESAVRADAGLEEDLPVA